MKKKYDKVIFLDRDGVINKDPGGWTKYNYVTCPSDFRFLPGALAALRRLKEGGYKVIVISNQAGVNKGYFTKKELKVIDRRMRDGVRKRGGKIEASYYCVHTKEEDCPCRKPKAGLFDKARKAYKIDSAGTYFIGDTPQDVMAGADAGLKTILLLTGKTSKDHIRECNISPGHVCDSLKEAVAWLFKQRKAKKVR